MTAQPDELEMDAMLMDGAAASPAQSSAPIGEQLDLRDIHLPEQPGFWPPAPGWWLLAVVLLAALIAAGWSGWRAWRRRRRRRMLLAELERLRVESDRGPALAAAVSALLKRVALSRYPRVEVAPLSGEAWLTFLDRTGGDGRFVAGPGQVLADAPYAPDVAAVDASGLLTAAREWMLRNS